MPVLSSYSTPAFQKDFTDNPALQAELDALWSSRAEGWIQQAILGNPWNLTNAANQTWFYDPTVTDIPQDTGSAQVAWNAFPGRIQYYLTGGHYSYTPEDMLSLADTGYDTSGKSFPQIPQERCPQPDWDGPLIAYGPYGPRGWLDEYCEWSVARDAANNIVRIDFVCENPEYWYSMWRVSPPRVQQLYQSTLNHNAPANRQIRVALEDLFLHDPTSGKPVIDPTTGHAAYNPLNKWNNGPTSVRLGTPAAFTGGAMHLTSTPNTLQTELNLAGSATVQRTIGNGDPQALICCGQYGQNFRHSDPHIGQAVNQVVSGGNAKATVCLANPLGLYMQVPDFSGWSLNPAATFPPNAKPSDVYQIVRGAASLVDPVTGKPFPAIGSGVGGFVLHAVCQIPSEWLSTNPSLTLADVFIDNEPINWAGQIALTFDVALYARPLKSNLTPPSLDCVGSPATPFAMPLQLFYQSVWDGYYANVEPNPGDFKMPLASNTTIIPAEVQPGSSAEFALTCDTTTVAPLPTVQISTPDGSAADPSISATVVGSASVTYAVPGNSYPGTYTLLNLRIDVAPEARTGVRGVRVTNSGQSPAAFAPALLQVVASQAAAYQLR
jgi:hypothetical protein